MIEPLLIGLKHRYSTKQLLAWKCMIAGNQWDDFIRSLLEVHYDPSYLRSGSVRQAFEADSLKATSLSAEDVARLASEMMAKSWQRCP
jgi:hypothetical protein